jgi:two-component system, cell cycle response regulator CpdR
MSNMSKNILVVEDEPASLECISHFLRKQGYEVREARDGAEAIELIDNSQFDLVLSDIRMPRVDGVALATNIPSRVPTIPIILMTAVPFELTRSLGYNLPCLSKPILLDELRTSVQTALAMGRNFIRSLGKELLWKNITSDILFWSRRDIPIKIDGSQSAR